MAVYKVPQDVEADDKLIGPFSFRQFIYLLIVAAAIAIGYFLSRIFLPLFIIPLPVVIFFGALALPLRKDQPMETYMAALVSFYLKPHRRLWNPDGDDDLVLITAPKVVEVQRTKELSQSEAEQRLSYLASIVDTRGWAVRGVDGQIPGGNSAMNTDVYNEAQQTEDILDATGNIRRSFDARLQESDTKHHEEVLARVQTTNTSQPAVPTPDPYAALGDPPSDSTNQTTSDPQAEEPKVNFNPYPAMHQSVVEPMGSKKHKKKDTKDKTEKTTSAETVSPDIINLANNPDLSVETIAREAKRIQKKQELSDEEVVISLR